MQCFFTSKDISSIYVQRLRKPLLMFSNIQTIMTVSYLYFPSLSACNYVTPPVYTICNRISYFAPMKLEIALSSLEIGLKDTPLGLPYHLTADMQMAEENMVQNAVQPNRNNDSDDNEWAEFEDDENTNDAEFQAINAQLDQLNSVLDNLEQKNDDIHAELIELLQSNRETRKQFQESQQNQVAKLEEPNA